MHKNEAIRIFMSYASEDLDLVKPFYEILKRLGYKPWLDKEDLLPGQDWHVGIMKEIKKTDFFMVFLTKNSSNKRGFMQREIKVALDLWKEKMPDDIFLIPVILEECKYPDQLSDFQYIEIYDSNEIHNDGPNFKKLKDALTKGSENIGKEPIIGAQEYQIVSKSIQQIQLENQPFDIEISYPQLESLGDQSYDKVNKYIFELIYSYMPELSEFREDLSEYTGEIFIDYQQHLLLDDLISLSFNYYGEMMPSPHPNHYTFTRNFILPSGEILTIDNIFKRNSQYLDFIMAYCIENISSEILQEEGYSKEEQSAELDFRKCYLADKNSYKNFYLTKNSINFVFSPSPDSSIPHVWGHSEVSIPYSEITEVISKKSILSKVIKL